MIILISKPFKNKNKLSLKENSFKIKDIWLIRTNRICIELTRVFQIIEKYFQKNLKLQFTERNSRKLKFYNLKNYCIKERRCFIETLKSLKRTRTLKNNLKTKVYFKNKLKAPELLTVVGVMMIFKLSIKRLLCKAKDQSIQKSLVENIKIVFYRVLQVYYLDRKNL